MKNDFRNVFKQIKQKKVTEVIQKFLRHFLLEFISYPTSEDKKFVR